MAVTLSALTFGACSGSEKGAKPEAATQRMTLYNAASIARPLKALADSFTAKTGIAVVQESQSSLELARRITEFKQIPDVIALADYKVFPTLLAPTFVDGWWLFARNRLVIAYTDKSKHHDELANDGWRTVLTRGDVEVGRADPNTDPSGYRTLMAFQLAEMHYAEKGLGARLLAGAAARNVRPREADQVGMLQAGALDYIWTYENLAKGAGLKYVTLPVSVDLGNARGFAFVREGFCASGRQAARRFRHIFRRANFVRCCHSTVAPGFVGRPTVCALHVERRWSSNSAQCCVGRA